MTVRCERCGDARDFWPSGVHEPTDCIAWLRGQLDLAHYDWENLSREVCEEREHLARIEKSLHQDERSLLARMAGNIAAGFLSRTEHIKTDSGFVVAGNQHGYEMTRDLEELAGHAVEIALAIVAETDRRLTGAVQMKCDLCKAEGMPDAFPGQVTIDNRNSPFGWFCSRFCAVHALVSAISTDLADGYFGPRQWMCGELYPKKGAQS